MTGLSKNVLENFQTRKTKEQKDKFIELLKSNYPDLQVNEYKGIFTSKNLVLGNIDSAEILLSAHYDTCVELLYPNLAFADNRLVTFLCALPLTIPMLLLVFLAERLVGNLTHSVILTMLVGYGVPFLFILHLLMLGKASTHTVNDNTSGVITLIETYEKLTEEQRKKTAIIFFDNEEKGLVGSRKLLKEKKELLENKLLINFDCVSDGDDILLVCSLDAAAEAERLWRCFPDAKKKAHFMSTQTAKLGSDQKGYKKGIGVAAMHHNRFGYYMPRLHTKRDVVFEEENIELISDAICRFV